ncbi:hypothetical protein MSG28_002863 [Choristoneura fumiferana]|uniref:Uncharacterized protein n=1 Tax=Choristoneura fumiferana TaxID=7141 RepID=A0ACC0JJS1_CHOFU|nr:hypothetical protein MSG28_002863 [Choristoneura fumiferana]
MLWSFVLLNVILVTCIWLFNKLTCGICKSSRHLVGKVIVISGGNAGIGYETAKDLAARGARVILGCRDEGRGTAARDRIVAATGNQDVHYRHLDLASLKSVREFADNFNKTEKRLDVLINNAGAFASEFKKTEDGLLLEMQSNHFGPFLLTNSLLPLLKSSAPSRIINVSSIAHQGGSIDFENLNAEKETEKTYGKINIYCNTKLCNILTAVELDRRLKGTGVTVNSLHPGIIVTDITKNDTLFRMIMPLLKMFCKNTWEGAQTTIHLAVAPEVASISGQYFRDCREGKPNLVAQDPEVAKKLWEVSEKLVKLK